MDYLDFRAQYEAMHPASVPQEPDIISDYPAWLEPLALIMFVAVSIVSGAHTISTMRYNMQASLVIPEDLKDFVAGSAFFGFELALFVSVFGWLRKDKRWVAVGATVAVFVVIVLANVQDVIRSIETQDIWNTLMSIGQSVGTPLVALFSGKLFVDIYQRRKYQTIEAQRQYEAALKDWDSEIEKAYKAELRKTKKASNIDQDGQKVGTPRQSRLRPHEQVRAYFELHPEDLDTPARQLESQIPGAKKSTIQNVQNELKRTEQVQSNGHQ